MMTYVVEWTRLSGRLGVRPCATYLEAVDRRDTILRLGLPATIRIEDVGRGDPAELRRTQVFWHRSERP